MRSSILIDADLGGILQCLERLGSSFPRGGFAKMPFQVSERAAIRPTA
jgi:hypothetical protein